MSDHVMSDQENATLFLVHALFGDSWGVQVAAINAFGSEGGFTPGLRLMMTLGSILREQLPQEVREDLVANGRSFLTLMRQAKEGM